MVQGLQKNIVAPAMYNFDAKKEDKTCNIRTTDSSRKYKVCANGFVKAEFTKAMQISHNKWKFDKVVQI